MAAKILKAVLCPTYIEVSARVAVMFLSPNPQEPVWQPSLQLCSAHHQRGICLLNTYKDAAITGRGTKPSQINVFTRVLKPVSLTQHPESVNIHCAEECYLPSFDTIK